MNAWANKIDLQKTGVTFAVTPVFCKSTHELLFVMPGEQMSRYSCVLLHGLLYYARSAVSQFSFRT